MSEYKIYDNIPDPIPGKRGGGKRTEKFPFSQLEVGKAFIIEASEKHPEPWKSYQSTVAGAQRRFATLKGEKVRRDRKTGETKMVQDWEPSRVFKLYKIDVDGKGTLAAAVKRTK